MEEDRKDPDLTTATIDELVAELEGRVPLLIVIMDLPPHPLEMYSWSHTSTGDPLRMLARLEMFKMQILLEQGSPTRNLDTRHGPIRDGRSSL